MENEDFKHNVQSEVREALEQYGLVDDPEINKKLIERVSKIIEREFRVEKINPLNLDGGPIKILGSSTPAPVASRETKQSNNHFQDVIKSIKSRHSEQVKNRTASREEEDAEIEIEEEGESVVVDPSDADIDDLSKIMSDEMTSLNPKQQLEVQRALPRKYNENSERTVRGTNKSISRID